MKYCVPYFKYFDYMKEVDEMIVPFHKEDIGFLKSLTSMPELTENKTIINIPPIFELSIGKSSVNLTILASSPNKKV